jgi:putative ABC transport system permease protein
MPLSPASPAGQYLLVRTADDPAKTMKAVRGMAATIHPALHTSVRRIEEDLAFQVAPFRAIAWLSVVLGMLALLLASVGLYGVMSFVVTRRTHEIGIRVALGAKPADVLRMFLFQGLRLTAVGVVLGIGGGVLISRLLATVLIDVSQLDPIAFGSVSAFLTMVALLAIFIPARRATRGDALAALRYE